MVADGPDWERAIILLHAKYPHYLDADLEFGAATIADVERWVGWTAGR